MANDAPTLPPSSTVDAHFPSLTGGVLSSAPPRALGDPSGQYLWRDTSNMIVRDGVVIGRPGIVASFLATPPTIAGVDTTEVTRYVNLSANGAGTFCAVAVTDRSIYVRVGVNTYNVTPEYLDGTVSLTNGSAAMTGTTTLWQTYGINGAYMFIDGVYYYVVVTGDTTATITPNYAGVTGAGKAYTFIRRFGAGTHTFQSVDSEIFCEVYNGDLYVAGTRIFDGTGAVSPAVIKVVDIYTTPVVGVYLTASSVIQPGLDAITGLTRICGVGALQDGRVLFPGNANEVFYSSPLSTAVWTTAPGGSTPLAEVDNIIRAMGRIGATRTFHHAGGIVNADPTGVADPPLRFQVSQAGDGTIAPLSLVPYMGGEAFLAMSGDVRLFDGNTTRSLGGGEMLVRTRALAFDPIDYCRYSAWAYPGRDEYTLFRGNRNASTKFWTYQATTDSWWPNETTVVVGCGSAVPEGSLSSSIQGVLGTGSASGTGIMSAYKEGVADDVGAPTYSLETDDIDHGAPLSLKTPQRVAVVPVAAMTNLVVDVRVETASTYPGGDSQQTKATLAAKVPTWFDFVPARTTGSAVSAARAHRYKISGATLRLGLFAMLLRAAAGAESEYT